MWPGKNSPLEGGFGHIGGISVAPTGVQCICFLSTTFLEHFDLRTHKYVPDEALIWSQGTDLCGSESGWRVLGLAPKSYKGGWKPAGAVSFPHTQSKRNVFIVEWRCHECISLFGKLLNLFLIKLLWGLNVKIQVKFLAQHLSCRDSAPAAAFGVWTQSMVRSKRNNNGAIPL